MMERGTATRTEGWAIAGGGPIVAHYYDSTDRSLCGRWSIASRSATKRAKYDGNKCSTCAEKLVRRRHPKGRR